MKPNIGWLFYKNYYSGSNNLNAINYKAKTANIVRQKLSDFIAPDLKDFTDLAPVELITTYPGLLLGSGYQHDFSHDDAFKIGFYFDYSTGLPVIPGSSVKGVLRSVFPFHNKDFGETFRQSRISYLKDLLREIGIDSVNITAEDIENLEKEIFEGMRNGEDMPIADRDIFLDVYPVKSYNDENEFLAEDYITPHYPKGVLKNPVPLKFLKILPQVEFHFYFKLNDSQIIKELNKEKKRELFEKILLDIGIGAKTNVGYGQFTGEKPERQSIDNRNYRNNSHSNNSSNTSHLNPTSNMIERYTVVKTSFKKDSTHQAKIIKEIDGYFIFEVGDAQLIKKISSIKDKFEKDKKRREKGDKASNYKMVKVGDEVTIVVRTDDGKSFTVQTDWS